MGNAALVAPELRQHEALITALENSGIRIAIAMWAHLPEYESWRFVLASKDLDKFDLRDAYLKIREAFDNAGITVWETPTLHIMKTTDPFIRAMRKTFKNLPTHSGIRVGGYTWAGRYIDDGYAYKIA